MFNNILKVFKMKFILVAFFFINVNNAFAAGDSDFPPNYYDIIALILIAIVMIAFVGLSILNQEKK